MGSGRLGSGSLAAIFYPCNRLSRDSFGPPICTPFLAIATGTAAKAHSFLLWLLAGA